MKRSLWLFAAVLLVGWAMPAQAQLFFRRPTVRADASVAELISTVKADKNERRRLDAATALRNYNGQQNPEIVPVLIDVLYHDSDSSVRMEVVQTLGRMRPVSNGVGQALEHAASNDRSLRVRLNARSALIGYQLAGYRQGMKQEAAPGQMVPTTAEPPLADGSIYTKPNAGPPMPPPLPGPTLIVPQGQAQAQPQVTPQVQPQLDPGIPTIELNKRQPEPSNIITIGPRSKAPVTAEPVSRPRPLPVPPNTSGFSTVIPQQPVRSPAINELASPPR